MRRNEIWFSFIVGYNQRLGKAPLHELDVHRPLGPQDDLEHTLIWKEPRQVSKRLTTQYDKVQYLLFDTPAQRRLIGREIMVYHYCDDRVELRGPEGELLEYFINDHLAPVNQGPLSITSGLAMFCKWRRKCKPCAMMCALAACQPARQRTGSVGHTLTR
ncbi:hypothetical protein [Aeromonas piscicola]|uniref:hypothetical protein n=1 Tax=Aeromonas piscicola TaxID=600645 RepID=UPI0028E9222E|nr:hypothetical protein [Aeromonas piscicola]